MARKRKRAPIPWTTVLAVALGVNIVVAVLYSPLFALTRVRVVGYDGDHAGLEEKLQSVSDLPAPWGREARVETDIQSLPGVDHAILKVNIFGHGALLVTMRRPVARLEKTRVVLGADGELWRTHLPVDQLVSVKLPSEAFDPTATFARPVNLASVANLALRLRQVWPAFDGEITLNSTGILCLNRDRSGRVVLGGSDALEDKLRRLSDLLQKKPELFTSPTEVNLTSPKHPAFSPIAPQSHEATEHSSVGR